MDSVLLSSETSSATVVSLLSSYTSADDFFTANVNDVKILSRYVDWILSKFMLWIFIVENGEFIIKLLKIQIA